MGAAGGGSGLLERGVKAIGNKLGEIGRDFDKGDADDMLRMKLQSIADRKADDELHDKLVNIQTKQSIRAARVINPEMSDLLRQTRKGYDPDQTEFEKIDVGGRPFLVDPRDLEKGKYQFNQDLPLVGPVHPVINPDLYKKNEPKIMADNIAYLMDLGMTEAEATGEYTSMVTSFFGNQEPKDIRPLTKMIRQWAVDASMERQGVDPAMLRLAMEYVSQNPGVLEGGDLTARNIVQENLPLEKADQFAKYVSQISDPEVLDSPGLWGVMARTVYMAGGTAKMAGENIKGVTATSGGGLFTGNMRSQEAVELEKEKLEKEGYVRAPDTATVGVFGGFKPNTQRDEFEEHKRMIAGDYDANLDIKFGKIRSDSETQAALEANAIIKINQARLGLNKITDTNIFGKAWYGGIGLMTDVTLSAGAGAASMSPVGSLQYWYAKIQPAMFDNMLEQGFDPKTAMNHSRLTSYPVALVNTLQAKAFAEGWKLRPGAIKDAVRAGEVSMANYIVARSKTTGVGYLTEMSEETVEEAISLLGLGMAEYMEKNHSDVDVDWGQQISQSYESLKEASIAMILPSARGGAMHVSNELRQIHRLADRGLDKDVARSIAMLGSEGKRSLFVPEWARDLSDDSIKKMANIAKIDSQEDREKALTEFVNETALPEMQEQALGDAVELMRSTGALGVVTQTRGKDDPIPGAEPGTTRTGQFQIDKEGFAIIDLAFGADIETGAHEVFHMFERLIPGADKELVYAETRKRMADQKKKDPAAFREKMKLLGIEDPDNMTDKQETLAVQELSAEMFGKYRKNLSRKRKNEAGIDRVFRVIEEKLRQIRNAFRKAGYKTYEDVFKDLSGGKYNFGQVKFDKETGQRQQFETKGQGIKPTVQVIKENKQQYTDKQLTDALNIWLDKEMN
jgi:hypothetical protein